MNLPSASSFEIQVFDQAGQIPPEVWEAAGGSQPFQSQRWYAFGERVLTDCLPFYILLWRAGRPIGRAAFWLVRDEPLPLPAPLRAALRPILRRWPLLICRSPLAGLSGMTLPAGEEREAALEQLLSAAASIARRHACSFVLLDFIEAEEIQRGWPNGYRPIRVADPGTWMPFEWDNLEAYLAAGNKDDRQHYKRSLRKAAERGIQIHRQRRATSPDEALALIRRVAVRHGDVLPPWTARLLEHLEEADGVFLEARVGERLVGCGALLYDGEAQLATALGLDENVPYVYFALVYASLEEACQRRARLLRWGSGAYEVKHRLGFRPETNNHTVIAGNGALPRLAVSLLGGMA
ncbi:MAG: GNAT family N-acetyltransferase [Anaerolineales bacterium]